MQWPVLTFKGSGGTVSPFCRTGLILKLAFTFTCCPPGISVCVSLCKVCECFILYSIFYCRTVAYFQIQTFLTEISSFNINALISFLAFFNTNLYINITSTISRSDTNLIYSNFYMSRTFRQTWMTMHRF